MRITRHRGNISMSLTEDSKYGLSHIEMPFERKTAAFTPSAVIKQLLLETKCSTMKPKEFRMEYSCGEFRAQRCFHEEESHWRKRS